jgi:uncharacterized protein (DUF2267 family)
MVELDWDDRHYGLQALRGVLHTLRDRLLIDQMAHLAAQLPLLVRGLFFEDWVPARTPVVDRHREEFVERILPYFASYAVPIEPEEVTRAVFAVLARHISPGEVKHVKGALPRSICDLWVP